MTLWSICKIPLFQKPLENRFLSRNPRSHKSNLVSSFPKNPSFGDFRDSGRTPHRADLASPIQSLVTINDQKTRSKRNKVSCFQRHVGKIGSRDFTFLSKLTQKSLPGLSALSAFCKCFRISAFNKQFFYTFQDERKPFYYRKILVKLQKAFYVTILAVINLFN